VDLIRAKTIGCQLDLDEESMLKTRCASFNESANAKLLASLEEKRSLKYFW